MLGRWIGHQTHFASGLPLSVQAAIAHTSLPIAKAEPHRVEAAVSSRGEARAMMGTGLQRPAVQRRPLGMARPGPTHHA